MSLKLGSALALAATLAGCATWSALPLGDGAGASVARLKVPASSMPTRPLARHVFNPANGLDVTEVAMLAVANNPALKIKRDDLGIAGAQAFAAGLLPDPQISAGMGYPTSSGPGLTRAFDFGLSEDLSALLNRSSHTRAAQAHQRQVNLELLWAEWQTIARSRLLFSQIRTNTAQEQLLHREAAALVPLGDQIERAIKAGNLTYAGAASGLDAVAGIHRQLAQATRARIKAEHALRLLLGLKANAPLHLVGKPWPAKPTTAQVEQALTDLPDRRPDLLALQAGYQAQNARLRGAILAQFPAITLGFTRSRDTSNIYTSGFSLGITLPLFNRNRGNIAIARATRQRLHDVYAARLLTTRSDMDQLQKDLASLHAEMAVASRHAGQLDKARAAAKRAWQAGLLDWPTYLAIRQSALQADQARLALRQQLATQSIALETLVGGDWSTTNEASAMAHTHSAPSPRSSS